MAYRLRENESLATGLKRIAEEQVSNTIQQLQSVQHLNESIYEARKSLKRTRSVMRLLRNELGPIYEEENRRLRDIARRFSALRDAHVSLEVLEGFSKLYKRQSALNRQRHELASKREELQDGTDWQGALDESIDLLSRMRRRIEDWPLPDISEATLAEEIRKTHKEGRHALEKASASRTAEDFHELRKSVKRELNQVRLVNSCHGPEAQLKALAKMLGDHHNLAVMLANLENASKRFRIMAQRQIRVLELDIIGSAMGIYGTKDRFAAA